MLAVPILKSRLRTYLEWHVATEGLENLRKGRRTALNRTKEEEEEKGKKNKEQRSSYIHQWNKQSLSQHKK